MKANELMVGDFVLTPLGKIAKVFEISSIDNEIGAFFTPADGDVFDLTEIKPIPVTSEILSANDWDSQWHDDGEVYFFNGNNIGDAVDFNVRRADESNKGDLSLFDGDILIPMWNAEIEVRYVHEIQHLLRIVSNNPFAIRLADNFKIK